MFLTAFSSSVAFSFIYEAISLVSISQILFSIPRLRLVFEVMDCRRRVFLLLCRNRIRRSLGILLLDCPGLLANFGQLDSRHLMVELIMKVEYSSPGLLSASFSQSMASSDWFMGSQLALCRLKEERVRGVGGGGLEGWELGWITCLV